MVDNAAEVATPIAQVSEKAETGGGATRDEMELTGFVAENKPTPIKPRTGREERSFLASLADRADRPKDALDHLLAIAKLPKELSLNERVLFCKVCSKAVGNLREVVQRVAIFKDKEPKVPIEFGSE